MNDRNATEATNHRVHGTCGHGPDCHCKCDLLSRLKMYARVSPTLVGLNETMSEAAREIERLRKQRDDVLRLCDWADEHFHPILPNGQAEIAVPKVRRIYQEGEKS